ncbi:MAG: helix-turn-helix domain-containing protein [Candidatus Pacebacteria bacterium]|nr:helix-turn-helix domain-containing protein [Candidatus Paceibacterota bacterium]
MPEEIDPNQIYNSKEVQTYLKISESTIKRWLKKGIINANKVGGRYKFLGREVLRVISPEVETKARRFYYNIKDKTKKVIDNW